MMGKTALLAFALLLLALPLYPQTGGPSSQLCAAAVTPTYMDVVQDPANSQVSAFVYNRSASYVKLGIEKAMIIRVNLSNPAKPSFCYQIAGSSGSSKGWATFAYDPNLDGCTDYWFIFCPSGKNNFGECLKGTGITVTADTDKGRCTGYAAEVDPPAVHATQLLSHNELYFCNQRPKNYAALCWPLLLIFGLLVGASFALGRNPFEAFDFSSPRMGRGRQYTMRVQQRSFDFLTYAMGLEKAGETAGKTYSAAKGEKEVRDEKGNLVGNLDKDGKTVRDAKTGKEIGTFEKGKFTSSGGETKDASSSFRDRGWNQYMPVSLATNFVKGALGSLGTVIFSSSEDKLKGGEKGPTGEQTFTIEGPVNVGGKRGGPGAEEAGGTSAGRVPLTPQSAAALSVFNTPNLWNLFRIGEDKPWSMTDKLKNDIKDSGGILAYAWAQIKANVGLDFSGANLTSKAGVENLLGNLWKLYSAATYLSGYTRALAKKGIEFIDNFNYKNRAFKYPGSDVGFGGLAGYADSGFGRFAGASYIESVPFLINPLVELAKGGVKAGKIAAFDELEKPTATYVSGMQFEKGDAKILFVMNSDGTYSARTADGPWLTKNELCDALERAGAGDLAKYINGNPVVGSEMESVTAILGKKFGLSEGYAKIENGKFGLIGQDEYAKGYAEWEAYRQAEKSVMVAIYEGMGRKDIAADDARLYERVAEYADKNGISIKDLLAHSENYGELEAYLKDRGGVEGLQNFLNGLKGIEPADAKANLSDFREGLEKINEIAEAKQNNERMELLRMKVECTTQQLEMLQRTRQSIESEEKYRENAAIEQAIARAYSDAEEGLNRAIFLSNASMEEGVVDTFNQYAREGHENRTAMLEKTEETVGRLQRDLVNSRMLQQDTPELRAELKQAETLLGMMRAAEDLPPSRDIGLISQKVIDEESRRAEVFLSAANTIHNAYQYDTAHGDIEMKNVLKMISNGNEQLEKGRDDITFYMSRINSVLERGTELSLKEKDVTADINGLLAAGAEMDRNEFNKAYAGTLQSFLSQYDYSGAVTNNDPTLVARAQQELREAMEDLRRFTPEKAEKFEQFLSEMAKFESALHLTSEEYIHDRVRENMEMLRFGMSYLEIKDQDFLENMDIRGEKRLLPRLPGQSPSEYLYGDLKLEVPDWETEIRKINVGPEKEFELPRAELPQLPPVVSVDNAYREREHIRNERSPLFGQNVENVTSTFLDYYKKNKDYYDNSGEKIVMAFNFPVEKHGQEGLNERLEQRSMEQVKEKLAEAGIPIDKVSFITRHEETMTMEHLASEDENWKAAQKQFAAGRVYGEDGQKLSKLMDAEDYNKIKKARTYEEFQAAVKESGYEGDVYMPDSSARKLYDPMRSTYIGPASQFDVVEGKAVLKKKD